MTESLVQRTRRILESHRNSIYRRTDRLFAYLMVGQWLFAIVIAIFVSPYAWEGKVKVVHAHVYIAVFLGGAISSLPVVLAIIRPGAAVTRYVIAVAQMMWSALLIHLTGGRIETHFHVFGSLAFLAFYRDWRVLVPATVVVAADHLTRQALWPESVFGITNPESWRFIEHAFWVVFEDIILVMSCLVGVAEMQTIATRTAGIEELSEREQEKSQALDRALTELRGSHEALVRSEKLAAVGQLAASVGHELRNPLTAVRNANAYISKKLGTQSDPKVTQFLGVIDRELGVCTKIISDLLDFARERPLAPAPCPLKSLVDEAMSVVPAGRASVRNEITDDLPVPSVDREQFRQILVNLIQNAVEALPADREGHVTVRAQGGGGRPWRIEIADNGAGMPPEVVNRIFEPLFTTKMKGTGLGLAIVAGAVKRHGGSIKVQSQPGEGTCFAIELPAMTAEPRATQGAQA
jgi:signal transduction histidine kinase